MTSNTTWQYQGRQQHGWFGTGTGPHDIHQASSDTPPIPPITGIPPTRYPSFSKDRSDGIQPVYPLEYLLGVLAGGGLVRAGVGAMVRNFGRSRPAPEERAPEDTLNPAKQNKHIVGAQGYVPGKNRSILLADPRDLLRRFAGRGDPVNALPRGSAGFKESFNTGDEIIGIWKSQDGRQMAETTRGNIIYDGNGDTHIVPARPTGWTDQ